MGVAFPRYPKLAVIWVPVVDRSRYFPFCFVPAPYACSELPLASRRTTVLFPEDYITQKATASGRGLLSPGGRGAAHRADAEPVTSFFYLTQNWCVHKQGSAAGPDPVRTGQLGLAPWKAGRAALGERVSPSPTPSSGVWNCQAPAPTLSPGSRLLRGPRRGPGGARGPSHARLAREDLHQ